MLEISSTIVTVATTYRQPSRGTETFTLYFTSATADIPGPDDISVAILCNDGVGTINDPPAGPPPPTDNLPPDAVDDNPACGVEGIVAVTGNVLDNDTDPEHDALSVTEVGGTPLVFNLNGVAHVTLTHGALAISADGNYTYTYTGDDLPVGAMSEGPVHLHDFRRPRRDRHGHRQPLHRCRRGLVRVLVEP